MKRSRNTNSNYSFGAVNVPLVFGFLIVAFVIVFIVYNRLRFNDSRAAFWGMEIFIIIFLLTFVVSIVHSYAAKIAFSTIGFICAMPIAKFFLEAEADRLDIALFVVALSIIFVSVAILVKMVVGVKSIDIHKYNIKTIADLLAQIFRSADFILLFGLVLWLLFFTALATTMGLFGWGIIVFLLDAFVVSFVLIFMGMLLITLKLKRNLWVISGFAVLIVLFLPSCFMLFFKMMSVLDRI